MFLIAESEAHPVLARVQRPTSPPEDLNLISGGAEHYWEVRLQGFRRHERMGQDADSLDAGERVAHRPVARTQAFRDSPQDRARSGADDETHRHGERVHAVQGVVPTPEWEATLPLTACHVAGDTLTVGFATNATRPKDRDRPQKARGGGAARHPADGQR